MRRRGLEPPPGYPGPGPQPCHPGVISVLCVQIVRCVLVSGWNGRHGRSGCCHGCCHGRCRCPRSAAVARLPVLARIATATWLPATMLARHAKRASGEREPRRSLVVLSGRLAGVAADDRIRRSESADVSTTRSLRRYQTPETAADYIGEGVKQLGAGVLTTHAARRRAG